LALPAFKGEELRVLDKTFVRKNSNGVLGGIKEENQTGLFDG
jgi:hypothetical protein